MADGSAATEFYGFEQGRVPPALTKQQRYYKIALIATNTLFLIFAIVLMSLGSYALNTTANTLTAGTLPRGIIVLGVFILFLSLLGLVSAWRESRILLGVYFTILMLLTIILLAVGIAVYSQSSKALQLVGQAWTDHPPPYNTSAIIVTVQNSLNCCGLYGTSTAALPCPTTQSQTTPCAPLLQSTLQSTYYSAGAAGIAFSILMGCCLGFIIVLMRGIKSKQFAEQKRAIHESYREAKEQEPDYELPKPVMTSIYLTQPASSSSIVNKPRGNTVLYDQDDDDNYHTR